MENMRNAKPELCIMKPQAGELLRNSFQTSLLKTCMHVYICKNADIYMCVYMHINIYY